MAQHLPTTPSEAGQLPSAEAGEAVYGHETTASEATADHGSGGLPQFDLQYWGGQIIWLVVLFAILYALLSRVFIPRLRRVVEAREATIAGALSAARAVQAEADAQAQAARDELAEARLSAQRTTSDAKAQAQAEAQRRQVVEEAKLAQHLAQAEDRIKVSRDQAMSNVRQIAVETAEAITEKLTGRPATPGEVDAALATQPSVRGAAA